MVIRSCVVYTCIIKVISFIPFMVTRTFLNQILKLFVCFTQHSQRIFWHRHEALPTSRLKSLVRELPVCTINPEKIIIRQFNIIWTKLFKVKKHAQIIIQRFKVCHLTVILHIDDFRGSILTERKSIVS